MAEAGRFCTIISTPTFEAMARGVLAEDDRRELDLCLADNPRLGVLIPRTGGFRKARFARPSRGEGKSGGVRVVYYFVDRRDRVYLLLVYAKNRKDDLTRAEENRLRQIASELESEE